MLINGIQVNEAHLIETLDQIIPNFFSEEEEVDSWELAGADTVTNLLGTGQPQGDMKPISQAPHFIDPASALVWIGVANACVNVLFNIAKKVKEYGNKKSQDINNLKEKPKKVVLTGELKQALAEELKKTKVPQDKIAALTSQLASSIAQSMGLDENDEIEDEAGDEQ